MAEELKADQVRRACDPDGLGLKSTTEVASLEGIIGQRRAVQALQFGLDMQDSGFNIYVAGRPGTGKTTAVQAFLEARARDQAAPPDWCYVNNFADPYRPVGMMLPTGRGRTFQRDIQGLVRHARRDIPRLFEGEEYTDRRNAVEAAVERERQGLLREMEGRASAAGFKFQVTQMGAALIPIVDGKLLDQDAFAALPEDRQHEIERNRQALHGDLTDTLKQARRVEQEAQERLRRLDREAARYAVGHLLEELMEKYRQTPQVITYLEAIQEDMLENLDVFRGTGGDKEEGEPKSAWAREVPFRRYEVNVVVDNGSLKGAPVVIEQNPTYPNLFGRIEKEAHYGALHTDFTLIRSGSVHRANGGYLVLPVMELLKNGLAWDSLKRAIRGREAVIEEPAEAMGYVATRGLRPEPISLDVKVVLIGSPLLYHALLQADDDFGELFKVKADFDVRMERSQQNVRSFLAFVATLCRKEDLPNLDAGAAGKMVEYASRLSEDQEKLSTHFGEIANRIREACFWARKADAAEVSADHVRRAIEEKVYRSNLIQERIQEMVQRGTLLIDTEGTSVGQVNGLAVISLGDYAFGRPNRITASIGLGRGGVVDIEREARLGGALHTKGVLILSGYLTRQYAQDKPLALSARLVFEQSYEGVDGDSASSAELYALLSALSGLPLRQDIAATGSVNQQGDVQAIGGVNEKVEGFYEVCRAAGLTGNQGVLIPASNVPNLMLKEEVVAAVAEGQFHVWPVQSIDEGIELLTGVAAGAPDEEGRYPEDSVHGRVDGRLGQLAERMQAFGRPPEE